MATKTSLSPVLCLGLLDCIQVEASLDLCLRRDGLSRDVASHFFSYWNIVYHEHDSPDVRVGAMHSRFIRMMLWTRKELALRAELSVLPNRSRAKTFKQTTGTRRPLLEVWNCSERAEAQVVHISQFKHELVLFYHGSIVPARLPLAVLQTMSRFPNVRLRVAGYETIGHPNYVSRLRREAQFLNIGSRFDYLGQIPRRVDLLEECRRADVGLALMPPDSVDLNEQTMAGASNKPFDYLACGLALLVSDLLDWRQFFVEPGYALACDPLDPASIEAALREFLDHPKRRYQMGERGRQRILSDWNYESQFDPVFRLMNSESTEEILM